MLKKSWIIALLATTGLAGCLENDAERALVGAGVGCVAGETIGNNNCVQGALGGAVIGALADDVTGR
ncbi:glycine zipper 2TM domain-containing protein [Cognatiyoonia koreensis]|uniref:glycine zipper 2TM domain-containing protein n=1 Tax=Cognatiyoonia koreensis TaxID=364200 RepID=UPI000B7F800F|nr:glycine zipper 2TM domain-containing protein [Cognatiyoonia koreensis]